MSSSVPPAVEIIDPDSVEVLGPETAKSGVRPTEEFVKAVAARMKPVRIDVARTLGKQRIRRVEHEPLFEDSDDDGLPNDAVLKKLADSSSPEDFIDIIDLMFDEDDKKKKRPRKGV